MIQKCVPWAPYQPSYAQRPVPSVLQPEGQSLDKGSANKPMDWPNLTKGVLPPGGRVVGHGMNAPHGVRVDGDPSQTGKKQVSRAKTKTSHPRAAGRRPGTPAGTRPQHVHVLPEARWAPRPLCAVPQRVLQELRGADLPVHPVAGRALGHPRCVGGGEEGEDPSPRCVQDTPTFWELPLTRGWATQLQICFREGFFPAFPQKEENKREKKKENNTKKELMIS